MDNNERHLLLRQTYARVTATSAETAVFQIKKICVDIMQLPPTARTATSEVFNSPMYDWLIG